MRRLFYLAVTVMQAAYAQISTPSGYIIQTVAGTNYLGDKGAATGAVFTQPEGIAVDSAGNIYVADAGENRVRRIAPDGTISTFAGTGIAGFSGDGGAAVQAQLQNPYGLALDATGNLYIADLGNALVREVTTDGHIHTVAGGGQIPASASGADGSPATVAALDVPRNVAVDGGGVLYISDFGANQVYAVSSDGTLTTVAGTGMAGYTGDNGLATLATLSSPAGIAVDATGIIYIADSGNNCVRTITNGIIATVFSTPSPTGIAVSRSGVIDVAASSYVGTLSGQSAGSGALDVAFDSAGDLFTTSGTSVMELSASGQQSTVAGGGSATQFFGGDGGPAVLARLYQPAGIASDALGNVYIADTGNNRIRLVTSSGTISTIAGTGQAGLSGDGALATQAQLNGPRSVSSDSNGNIYIADTLNNALRMINSSGLISTVSNQLSAPDYVLALPNGATYVSDTGNNRVVSIDSSGSAASVASAQSPSGLAADTMGNLYFAGKTSISKLDNTGVVTIVQGGLNAPRGLVFGTDGSLLFCETGANRVRELSPSGSLVTLAGTGVAGFSGDNGTATLAELNLPSDLMIDSFGTVWIADTANQRIRTLSGSAAPIGLGSGSPLAVLNAASLTSLPLAPGEIVSIFGTGFTANQTNVTINGTAATVLYSSATQINAVLPQNMAVNGNVTLALASSTLQQSAVLPAAISAPALFTLSTGTGQAAAINQDGTVNGAGNPIARNSIISLYATGQGQTGAAVAVTIGSYPADVQWAGAAPGFQGLMQINVRVPGGFTPTGNLSVTLTVANASSPAGVTIAVQ